MAASGVWKSAGANSSALPLFTEHALQRFDGLLDAVEVRVDAVGAAVSAQGGAELLLLHEALGHAAGGAEVVGVEPQHLLAIGDRAGVVAAAEVEDGALVVRLGEARRLADERAQAGEHVVGAGLAVADVHDALQLLVVV